MTNCQEKLQQVLNIYLSHQKNFIVEECIQQPSSMLGTVDVNSLQNHEQLTIHQVRARRSPLPYRSSLLLERCK
jgi:hypothetical protein